MQAETNTQKKDPPEPKKEATKKAQKPLKKKWVGYDDRLFASLHFGHCAILSCN